MCLRLVVCMCVCVCVCVCACVCVCCVGGWVGGWVGGRVGVRSQPPARPPWVEGCESYVASPIDPVDGRATKAGYTRHYPSQVGTMRAMVSVKSGFSGERGLTRQRCGAPCPCPSP